MISYLQLPTAVTPFYNNTVLLSSKGRISCPSTAVEDNRRTRITYFTNLNREIHNNLRQILIAASTKTSVF